MSPEDLKRIDRRKVRSQDLIEYMLDDMGFKSQEVRDATRRHCLDRIEFCRISYGNLNVAASDFAQGYEEALAAHA